MQQTRRAFLRKIALAAPAGLALQPWAQEALAQVGNYEAPDFSEGNVLRSVAGLRPLRAAGVRLEIEKLGAKTLLHNYGHGGSGFTLAWGSAEEAADLLAQSVPLHEPIGILGGGVIGLSTAMVLVERGYKVKIYTEKMSPNTTSDLAGAQWSPSFIAQGQTSAEKARYVRMLAKTYRRYEQMAGPRYGVSLRPNYLPKGFHDGLLDVPAGILKPFQKMSRLPFRKDFGSGWLIQSWLIEPPKFLPALIEDLRTAGVEFVIRKFSSPNQLQELDESVLINCCGLGSRKLFADEGLMAMKGQLVLLKPRTGLDYILMHKGYIFCRTDAIVLGGSYQKGVYDTEVKPEVTRHILNLNRSYFQR